MQITADLIVFLDHLQEPPYVVNINTEHGVRVRHTCVPVGLKNGFLSTYTYKGFYMECNTVAPKIAEH